MSEDFKPNPSLFQECSLPFDTVEEADKAVQEFGNALAELRKKHRIMNLVYIVEISVKDRGEAALTGMFGRASDEERLAAYLFGEATARRQEFIANVLQQSKSLKRTKRTK